MSRNGKGRFLLSRLQEKNMEVFYIVFSNWAKKRCSSERGVCVCMFVVGPYLHVRAKAQGVKESVVQAC